MDTTIRIASNSHESTSSHESINHEHQADHHHHTHGAHPHHQGGHHLLQVEDLSISFRMYDEAGASFFKAQQKNVETIRNLSLAVHEGEIVAVVGASGSGKSLLANALVGMFEPNALVTGSIWFDGVKQDAKSLAALRGKEISLVPQSVASLDPLMKVGKQVRGIARGKGEQRKMDQLRRAQRQKELFERYDLDPSVEELYPYELSGGMARRILLCCALISTPRLLIADEPTPGLDPSLALAVLEDFRAFAREGGGVMLITHDIELALQIADRVAVFKDGTVIEETSVESFASPDLLKHPFSKALWHALPEHEFTATKQASGYDA